MWAREKAPARASRRYYLTLLASSLYYPRYPIRRVADSTVVTTDHRPIGPYDAYYHREVPPEDAELTHVGPGTPAGEYLRRYWQPVGLSSDLADLPQAVRVMGKTWCCSGMDKARLD